jgi:hypothetical protein
MMVVAMHPFQRSDKPWEQKQGRNQSPAAAAAAALPDAGVSL